MSVDISSEGGWIISHYNYTNEMYGCVKETVKSETAFAINRTLFLIRTPFLKNGQYTKRCVNSYCAVNSPKKRKADVNVLSEEQIFESEHLARMGNREENKHTVEYVQRNAERIIQSGQKCGCLDYVATEEDFQSNNLAARQTAEAFYRKQSKHLTGNFHGGNVSDVAVISVIQGEKYLIPPNCKFFCYDVQEMHKYLHLLDDSYNFILLDPPWWNKYIRRKKAKSSSAEGYQMMYDEDLAQLPISSLAAPGTLVAVWCTNSESHLSAIKGSLFPAWGVAYIGKWFWLKVTCGGQTVCAYSEPPGKQPFEQIVFGWFQVEARPNPLPDDGKIIVSVPSALHSHKPPLTDVLAKYLPPSPRCMELFARYLLPGYTSWGTEVLKLQQMCLYEEHGT